MNKSKIEFSELSESIEARLVMAQKIMEQPTLDSVNPHYGNKYASLPEIMRCVLQALGAVGCSFSQWVETVTDETGKPIFLLLKSKIYADNGKSLEVGSYPVMFGQPQQIGAALTYARRQQTAAIFGRCGEEDTDAEVKKQQPRNGDFVGRCRSCGKRYTFHNEKEMASVKCCKKPDWVAE